MMQIRQHLPKSANIMLLSVQNITHIRKRQQAEDKIEIQNT